MRSRILILLAVYSNIAATGPLRHQWARMQHHNIARFLNHTEISSIPVAIQLSTPPPISSSSAIPLIAATPKTSAIAATSSAIPTGTPLTPEVASSSTPTADAFTVSTPSQIRSTLATIPSSLSRTAVSEHSDAGSGATPASTSALYSGSSNSENHETAVVEPAETMSRLFNLGGSPPNYPQSSTNALSFSSTSSPGLSASTPTFSDVQSTFNTPNASATPSSSSFENQVSSPFEVAVSTSSPAAVGQFLSSMTPTPTSIPAAASQTPSPVVVPVPISSGVVQVLGPGGDTVNEFAPVTLDPSSPKPTGTAKYPTDEGGNTAMAVGFNSVYQKLNEDSPCNPGDPSQAYVCVDGELAECQSDETYALKSCPLGQSCYALPKPLGLNGVVVQCAVPSDATSLLHGLLSSTAVPTAVTSQPAQILQAEGDFSQATQSVGAQNPVQPVTFSPSAQSTAQSQPIAPTPSVPTVTTAAQQVHGSNPLNTSPNSEATPSASSTKAADANPTGSVPKALFAVVTAPVNDRVSSNGNSAQASFPSPKASQPSPEISTPVIQSSVMSPQVSADSPQLTETSVTSTSTSSADSAGITYAPMGVPVNEKFAGGNGQATVTVTVTVTTTEKTPPVTIIAS